MRVLVDPEDGELVEVLPDDVASTEPYDYADYRRANLQATREHREALRELREAEKTAARSDANYHRELAIAVGQMKAEHGATVAETMAKGEAKVAEAREKRLADEALARAAMEKVRLCRDDRAALAAMGSWSRQANADGWPPEG